MKKLTQKVRLLQFIKENGSITRSEARVELGIERLAPVIHILRNEGYNIETIYLKGKKNRYGDPVTVVKYELDVEDEDTFICEICKEELSREEQFSDEHEVFWFCKECEPSTREDY